MLKILKIPAVFDRYVRKKDRSYSLTFVTSLEIGKEDREAIDEQWQTEGWLIFSPNAEQVIVPTSKADTGTKSPIQILTARMFVCWKKRSEEGKTTQSYNEWVRTQFERIGIQYLDEL
jgi:hypothetical protein